MALKKYFSRKITKEDLIENNQRYEDNYLKMVDSVGRADHKKYTDIEKELARKEVEIRKYLRKEKKFKETQQAENGSARGKEKSK